MTDKEIVQKLIDRDNLVTQVFFFKQCEPLFQSIIRKLFDYPVDYDEFVNELYIYLMEDDAHRLRAFNFNNSLKGWLCVVATHFFLERKKHDKVIDNGSKEPLTQTEEDRMTPGLPIIQCEDLEQLLTSMPNQRYAYILEELFLDGTLPEDLANEMGIDS